MGEAHRAYSLSDSSATEALGTALAKAYLRMLAAPPSPPVTRLIGTSRAATSRAATGRAATGPAARSVVGPVAAPGGAVLYLRGELGAGKTTCVRSLLRTLGVTGPIHSPTYTLVESYELPKFTCVHVDLYRLHGVNEVDELGLRDDLGDSLVLVEWPDKGGSAVPPADLELALDYADDARLAALTARTRLGTQWLAELNV